MDENFKREYRDCRNAALLQLNEAFFDKIDEIADSFRDSLSLACDAAEQRRKKVAGETAYLEFTLLRTRFLKRDYTIPIMAYGPGWYGDLEQFEAAEASGGVIFEFYDGLAEEIDRLCKKYRTRLPARMKESCLCSSAEFFFRYVEIACRRAVMGWKPQAAYITEEFMVRCAEYMGYGVICRRSTPEWTDEQLLKWFARREEGAYSYRDFRGRNLKGADLSGMDLSGCDFGDCNLEGCRLKGADLTNTWFCGSHMEGAVLEDAWMPGARFDGADMKGVVLEGAAGVSKINTDFWMRPDHAASSFKGADLTDANLTYSSLDSADFTGALMQGALLSQSHREYYKLDDTQLMQARFDE